MRFLWYKEWLRHRFILSDTMEKLKRKEKKAFFTSHDLGLSFGKIFMNVVVFFAADATQRSCLVYVLKVTQCCNHGCVLDVV